MAGLSQFAIYHCGLPLKVLEVAHTAPRVVNPDND